VDDIVSLLKDKYDGYRYGCDTNNGMLSPPVFNAFGVNRDLANLDIHHNAWFHSGNSSLLAQQIVDEYALDSATEDRTILLSELKENSSVTAMRFYLLMYYAGYATLKACDKDSKMVTIGCPNADVKKLFKKDLLKTLFTKALADLEIDLCKTIFTSLISNEEANLQTHLRTLIDRMSYYNLNHEATYHSIISHALALGASSNVFVEDEVATSLGSIDTVVRDAVDKRLFIIEVGHICNIVYVYCAYTVYMYSRKQRRIINLHPVLYLHMHLQFQLDRQRPQALLPYLVM
jgi:hypothetical protein